LLTALPLVDVSGISVRLEQAIAGIDKLPLAPQGHVPLAASVETAQPAKEKAAGGKAGDGEAAHSEAAAPRPESAAAASGVGLGEAGTEPAPTPWWQQAWLQQTWRDLWQEVKGLVRIQRFDGQEPVLLAPEQGYFLRENIKLRLLSARLALLAHDQWTFRNALNEADKWLQRYFVADDASVQALRAQLQKMLQAELVLELPTLGDSLRAVQSLRQGKGAA
jgi:uroporphyrin-3 C-methyltransferase